MASPTRALLVASLKSLITIRPAVSTFVESMVICSPAVAKSISTSAPAVSVVNVPASAEVPPIAVLLMVPPEMVRSLATSPSAHGKAVLTQSFEIVSAASVCATLAPSERSANAICVPSTL